MNLTNKHFLYFKKQCQRQLNRFGLMSWNVYFEFGGAEQDAFASTYWKYAGRVATIRLAKNCPSPFGGNVWRHLQRIALHESLELLLATISSLAEYRTFNQIDFDKEVHAVIRTLEKLLTH